MKAARRHICLIAVLALFTGVGPMIAIGQDMRPTPVALAEKISSSGKRTVAVVDFTDLQGCVTGARPLLAEDISVAILDNAEGFSVIGRTNLKILMQEHKLASSGIIDPATARQLGKIAGVDTKHH